MGVPDACTADCPLAWVRYEPGALFGVARDSVRFVLDVAQWPGGERRALAYTDGHAQRVEALSQNADWLRPIGIRQRAADVLHWRVTVDADTLPVSCLECGACCFGDGLRYLRVSGDDHRRLAADDVALTHFVGNRCYMRLVDGHCGALTVAADAPRFVCGVYATRPTVCRQLERGSPACRAEHARKRARAGAASKRAPHTPGQRDAAPPAAYSPVPVATR